MHPPFKEDENGVNWITAKTRLGEQTLNIIPLEREGDWVILREAGEKLPIHAEAPRDMQRRLLRRHLRISNQNAMETIQKEAEENPTELFAQSALLKEFYPLWLSNGKKEFKLDRGTLRFTLDPQLGLVIEKEGKTHDTDE